jgi:hypothetical protein
LPKKERKSNPGEVTHICNTSYLGKWGLGASLGKKLATAHLNQKARHGCNLSLGPGCPEEREEGREEGREGKEGGKKTELWSVALVLKNSCGMVLMYGAYFETCASSRDG